jgi:hypothetical protein
MSLTLNLHPPVVPPVPPIVSEPALDGVDEAATVEIIVPVAVPGKTKQEGETLFNVQLKGEPPLKLWARDRLEAMQRYNKECGIISTTQEYTVLNVPE